MASVGLFRDDGPNQGRLHDPGFAPCVAFAALEDFPKLPNGRSLLFHHLIEPATDSP